jgi:hypothetical protein
MTAKTATKKMNEIQEHAELGFIWLSEAKEQLENIARKFNADYIWWHRKANGIIATLEYKGII